MSLLSQLKDAQKDAMRSKDKLSLGTIRMALAAVKQREVDERIELTDTDVLQILTKMVKQRQEAASQFIDGNRKDLADKEEAEIAVIKRFLPQPLSDEEVSQLVDDAIQSSGASDIKDMGKVMGILKPKVQGRADMGAVSKMIKAKLG
uniref:GatB/YqeY domain-containing protein n=1 Tax=Ningiella ruwaisensis TaxID=2364274 RepID=UPI00109FB342|nr:GatB/YqeY domain-containing protein [Ningiella ruwaisensis]